MTASVWNPGSNNIPLVDPLSQIKSQVFNATEGQTTFVITQFTYTPGNGALTIYVNRAKLVAADITEVNTTTFSIPACEVDDVVEVVANTAIQDPSSAVAQAVAAAAAASLSETNAATSETNAAASAALAATYVPMDWREAWVTAVAYVINDGVSINGKSYVCREAHTSGVFATDLGAGKWQLIADRGSDGTNGTNGLNGADGRGIVSVVRTSGTGAPGTADTYTITYTDATTSTYQVWNGTNGTGSGDMIAANNLSDLTNVATARTNLGLGSAATTSSSDYATAAQGAKADSAVQPAAIANMLETGDIGVSLQAYSSVLQSISSGGISVGRNRIINGAMMIDQRNAGASVTPADGAFCTDRFSAGLTQASKFSFQQVSDAPAGFVNSLKVTSLSAYSVAAGDLFEVRQNIEGLNIADLGWGAVGASTVTLSFWVKSSLTGTFGGVVGNSSLGRSYPFTYTISSANTWEQKTVTIAGDTTGTWLTTNGVGIRLRFSLGAGSTMSGTAGAWASAYYTSATGTVSVVGTNAATWQVTGVQLEKGSTATSFDYRPYSTELALCQRYYCQQMTASGVVNSGQTTICQLNGAFPVTMRTSPTMGATAVLVITDSAANYTQSSISVGSYLGTSQGFFMTSVANFTGLTSLRPVFLNYGAGSGWLTASAEL